MNEAILTCALRLHGLSKKESVSFTYSIHMMQRDSGDYQMWYFLTSVASLMHMLQKLCSRRERVTLSHKPVTKWDFKA